MFANVSLHLHRLSSRRLIRLERLDPERIDRTLRFFVVNLPALLQAERCNVFVYDPAAARAWLEIGTGFAADAPDVPTANTVIGEVIASGRPRVVDDAGGAVPSADGEGVVRNAVYVPIRSRFHAEVIGVVEAANKRGGSGFTPDDLRILEGAAEIVQDLVDSAFLAQKVYGATDAVLLGSRQLFVAVGAVLALGSLLTVLLMAAWSSLPVISDALNPALLPLLPEPGR
jgi:GAF domain-containing protein